MESRFTVISICSLLTLCVLLGLFLTPPILATVGIYRHILGAVLAVWISSPIVTVQNGSYSGIHSDKYDQDFFLGIPFAQPPVKDLRFRAPRSLESSWRLRTATEWPPFCVGYGFDEAEHQLSEDCLYLNVFRPSFIRRRKDPGLPVAVWIHGGGLFSGGTNDQRYNMSFILKNSVEMNKPMIVVSIQYRLSGWGFLGGDEALEGGATNLGYRDQRLALYWVQENFDAFGGDPTKVTIWGESAGGQSVGAQFLAYNGRDDHLFRAGIAQSGGPAVNFFPGRLPRGFNSTVYQTTYNNVVNSTSCASTISNRTSAIENTSLSCLRNLPFAELNAAFMNSSGPFVPQIDHDFITTYPSLQLNSGNFVHAPLMIGTNTDEGTTFGAGPGPNGTGVSTDLEWLSVLNSTGIPSNSTAAEMISILYPNIQALGIPSLTTLPGIIQPGSLFANLLGLQYRRLAAYFGDIVVVAPRRATNHAWSTFGVPSYSYRFDVTVSQVPSYIGATHFQEVAFVFNNTQGLGYATNNPFINLTSEDAMKFGGLTTLMSRSWIGFITELDPNANGIDSALTWPVYNTSLGGGEGLSNLFTINGTAGVFGIPELDSVRGEAIAYIMQNRLPLYGV